MIVSANPLNKAELDSLAQHLNIRVKVLDNLRHEAVSHIVHTTLTNTGNHSIPSSGWTLYFHSMLLAFPDDIQSEHNKSIDLEVEKVRFGVVQGDLYYMTPIGGFVPIPPGGERVYNVPVALWAVSRTDFMPLWYVTSDDVNVEPRICSHTASFDLDFVDDFDDVRQWKRWRKDGYNPYTPEDRAEKLMFVDRGEVRF